jgi:hypothetical protein
MLFLLLAAASGAAAGAPLATTSAQEAYEVKPTCQDSLQNLIDAAVPGSEVKARTDCIYREQVVVSTPLVLDGQGKAEIRGSDIWTDWIPDSGLWVSANAVPAFNANGECEQGSDGRCLGPEQVFREGEALRQDPTGSLPSPGEFSLNASRQVVLAEDPGTATIEVTTRDRWMQIAADDVTVQGFTMKHAAADAQQGGFRVGPVSNLILQDSTLSDAHSANLYYHNTLDSQFLNNELFNGGQLGFGGDGGADLLFRGNSVHHNNTEEFSNDWEAGGAKLTRTERAVVDGNHFFQNHGRGFWCDLDCIDTTISSNVIHHNLMAGILFEISDGADIFGNRVWENDWVPPDSIWRYNSGIDISSSRNALVHDNIVAWNGNGIMVVSRCRSYLADGTTCDLAHEWNNVYGNEVYNNTIVLDGNQERDVPIVGLGWQADIVDDHGRPYNVMFRPESNNRGYNNTYWISDSRDQMGEIRFKWGQREYTDLFQFNATPGEEDGKLIDTEQMDRILADAGVPIEPEEHSDRVPLLAPLSPLG